MRTMLSNKLGRFLQGLFWPCEEPTHLSLGSFGNIKLGT